MLKQKLEDNVLTLTMNRPEVGNAFNAELVVELTNVLKSAHSDSEVRIVVLRATGKHFCAGADLQWMLSMKDRPMEENVADAKATGELMNSIEFCRKPIIAVIQGAVMGGGVGLVACSDIVIADTEAYFALSETKLGLTPATVAPFVVNAIGRRHSRRYMLTGECFSAKTAKQIGLVHECVPAKEVEKTVQHFIDLFLMGGPQSHRKIKKLVYDVAERKMSDTLMENLAWRIANQRISVEGQEGITAFLEKRPPSWVPESEA